MGTKFYLAMFLCIGGRLSSDIGGHDILFSDVLMHKLATVLRIGGHEILFSDVLMHRWAQYPLEHYTQA